MVAASGWCAGPRQISGRARSRTTTSTSLDPQDCCWARSNPPGRQSGRMRHSSLRIMQQPQRWSLNPLARWRADEVDHHRARTCCLAGPTRIRTPPVGTHATIGGQEEALPDQIPEGRYSHEDHQRILAAAVDRAVPLQTVFPCVPRSICNDSIGSAGVIGAIDHAAPFGPVAMLLFIIAAFMRSRAA